MQTVNQKANSHFVAHGDTAQLEHLDHEHGCLLGTESSNTVPSTSIEQPNTKLLRVGIDSLYLTYRGELYHESAIKLRKLKELAQADKDSDQHLAQYPIGDHSFEVGGNGRNPFAFILTDNWFRLELAKLGAKLLPMAYCRISSELLTCRGADQSVEALSQIISELGSISEFPNVSRVDLCVDFVTDYPVELIENSQWVGKPRDFSHHTVGRQFSGVSIAAGGVISARLYNKTLEMKKNPRPYLENIWRDMGWDGQHDVWRLEFQYKRQVLRDLGIVKYSDLVRALAGLWGYSTQDWLRHTTPSESDKTQSRWPTSALWSVLQAAPWDGVTSVTRVSSERTRAPSDRTLFVNGLASLTSYMAREGYLNAFEAAREYLRAAQEYHNSLAERSGVDFENYITGKIAEKRRYYNSGVNAPLGGGIHPADQQVSSEYRKRSNGEL
ncbi:MAG: hypothetical protein Q8S94_08360 [Pseudohongiella sp.]|nr:hypothetical protein [Pseudohongiella sp.]